MTSLAQKTRDNEWLSYYDRFSYFSPDKVRDGCHPRIMEHSNAEKAIVLVHGLTDSPYFMNAIGDYFNENLGYNVYLPLLHCHGLKEPEGMEGVELEEWKANVGFAIKSASARCGQISIGGLSTGGTLSFYMAATNPKINGTLYLFSAALDLAGKRFQFIGDIAERLLRTPLAVLFDSKKPLIGDNPYRYDRIDVDGAKELARLIKETDTIIDGYDGKTPFPKKVFAAHSECDTTANIAGIEELAKVSIPERFEFFRIKEKHRVSHASLVLKGPILKNGETLEKENPAFQNMMDAIAAFEQRR
jgi:pimeloyl-ACP methyl ester carboxylesterase